MTKGNEMVHVKTWQELAAEMPSPYADKAAVAVLQRELDRVRAELSAVSAAARSVDKLTDDQRAELFGHYCKYCGSKDSNCQCWNDE